MDKSEPHLDELFKEIASQLKDYSPEERAFIIEQHLPHILGKPPAWAKSQAPNGYKIALGKTFNMGGFCVYYGFDDETQKPVILLQTRKEIGKDNKRLKGCIGGYVTSPEQIFEGLMRETAEEVCDDQGQPIFNPFAVEFQTILHGVDNMSQPNICYAGYAYQLTANDIGAIKSHINRMDSDATYRKAVHEASDGEVLGLELCDFESFISNYNVKDFTYHRQYDCVKDTIRKLVSLTSHQGRIENGDKPTAEEWQGITTELNGVLQQSPQLYTKMADSPEMHISRLYGSVPIGRRRGVTPAWVTQESGRNLGR